MQSVSMMPAALGTAELKTKRGTTKDIMAEILSCYHDTIEQTAEAAQYLKGASDIDTACNVAKFCDDYVKYKIDPEGKQWVRTPARLFRDHQGDCKSYSIFINSCLANLGIPHVFRFVSYKDGGDYTHVYPVAMIEGAEFPIDVVAWQLRRVRLGNEIQYKRKKDMAGTTEISRLCGIGDAETETVTSYSSKYSSGKANQVYLESLINLEQARANICRDPEQLEQIYNKLDFYEACLYATSLTDDKEILQRLGLLLAEYGEAGEFANSYDSMESRAVAIQNTISKLNADFATLLRQSKVYQDEFIARNNDFIKWWDSKIVAANDKSDEVSGIGALSDTQIHTVLQALAPGAMYATQPQTLDTAKAALKQKRHNMLVKYINSKNPNFSADAIVNDFRTGTINTFGLEPEQVIGVLKGESVGKVAGIGDFFSYKGVDYSTTEGMMKAFTKDYSNFGANKNYADFTKAPEATAALTTTASRSAGGSDKYAWVAAFTEVVKGTAQIGDTITGIMQQVNTLTGADTLSKIETRAGLSGVVPSVDDWTSSSWIKYAGYAAVGIGAWYILKGDKKKKRKR